MDHEYIEQEQIVDRYLMHQLSSEEAADFEEHFLHCQPCIDQLEVAEKLQRGLKRIASQDLTQVVARQGFFEVLRRLARSPQLAAVAMTGLVVVLAPWGVLLHQKAQHQRELGAMNAELAQQSAIDLAAGAELEEARAQTRAAKEELEKHREGADQELQQSNEIRSALESRLATAEAPRTNLQIVTLASERSSSAEASHVLGLGPTDTRVVFELEITPLRSTTYRVTLLRAEEQIWRGDGLIADARDNLVFDLPTRLLETSDYEMRVEARTDDGGYEPSEGFRFRVEETSSFRTPEP